MSTIYYDDGRVQLWLGQAIDSARELADGSVSCIVTSPPYFALRDYQQDGQIGAEGSVEEYIERLVALFRELRRVLAADGTLWLNLGDSYGTRGSSRRPRSATGLGDDERTRSTSMGAGSSKQLLMVPARVALALQADGWILRSETIWAKPNPMPESVTDRPTKSHEKVYLFAKSEQYYYNAEAIAEPVAPSTMPRLAQNIAEQPSSTRGSKSNGAMKAVGPRFGGKKYGDSDNDNDRTKSGKIYVPSPLRNARDVWMIATTPFGGAHFAVFPEELPRRCIRAGARPAGKRCDCDEVILSPLGEGGADHSVGIGRAGMSRERNDDEATRPITRRQQRADAAVLRNIQPGERLGLIESTSEAAFEHYLRTDRAGARPVPMPLRAQLVESGLLTDVEGECEHDVEPAGVVLDPFSGSGTTGKVALMEGHPYIGFDLNADYLDLSLDLRFRQQPLDFGSGS